MNCMIVVNEWKYMLNNHVEKNGLDGLLYFHAEKDHGVDFRRSYTLKGSLN